MAGAAQRGRAASIPDRLPLEPQEQQQRFVMEHNAGLAPKLALRSNRWNCATPKTSARGCEAILHGAPKR